MDHSQNQRSAPSMRGPHGLDKELHDLILYQGGLATLQPDPFPLPAADLAELDRLLSDGASVNQSRALHIAARQGADAELLQKLVERGGDVNAPDELGNTPLHEAATQISASILDVVKLGACGNVKNHKNHTPFDLLLQAVRLKQASVRRLMDKPQPNKRDMKNLRNAVVALLPKELSAQLHDGYLSPRMRKMLLITAEKAAEGILQTAFDMFKDKTSTRPLSDFSEPLTLLDYFPPDVLRKVTDKIDKGLLSGWSDLFCAFAECLSRSELPTVRRVQRILHEWKEGEENDGFFDKGERIEFGLDALISEAEMGRRNKLEVWNYLFCEREIEQLPDTPLDDVFNVVSVMCLHGCEFIPHGPYEDSMETF